MDQTLSTVRKYIPSSIFKILQPIYHFKLALLGALVYRFPSNKIKIIGVTGTKGKSSTTEIINAILEEAGFKTALSNTIRFKIGDSSQPNLYKMSMPGRMFMQKFIREAVNAKCDYVVMEMTSQGALLFRDRFINLDTLVFTNASPEHIEAHGSYENYIGAKLGIAKRFEKSNKPTRTLVANGDDKEAVRFLESIVDKKISFHANDVMPYEIKNEGISFTLNGQLVNSPLSGLFNLYNIVAGINTAQAHGVSDEIIICAIEKFSHIAGRVEKINVGQAFTVVVDYAHTTDSLEKFYMAFPNVRKICVLGGTGGGRDISKRSEMGKIADTYCDEIILTNEDPYDEDPHKIISDVASGISKHQPVAIMDRREAIHFALKNAKSGDAVLITGKGTDPYIMEANGKKTPWSDANVAREELRKIISN